MGLRHMPVMRTLACMDVSAISYLEKEAEREGGRAIQKTEGLDPPLSLALSQPDLC